MSKIFYWFLVYVVIPILSLWSVLTSDPNQILRQHEKTPYRSWIVTIAKIKKAILRK